MATPDHVHDHDSGDGLLPVDEARERLLERIKPLSPLELPLTEAYGCVLAHGLTDQPGSEWIIRRAGTPDPEPSGTQTPAAPTTRHGS